MSPLAGSILFMWALWFIGIVFIALGDYAASSRTSTDRKNARIGFIVAVLGPIAMIAVVAMIVWGLLQLVLDIFRD